MFVSFMLQEVGSIIGKKGEIVTRFREEVMLLIIIISRSLGNFIDTFYRNLNILIFEFRDSFLLCLFVHRVRFII